MKAMFRSVIDGLAKALNLPEVTITPDGTSALLLIDDFELCIRFVPLGFIVMFTVVAPMPQNNREEILVSLLDANTFYYQTQGFTLAAREDTGVTLQGLISLRLVDKDNISRFVENFINVAEYWQKYCQEKDVPASDSQSFAEYIPHDSPRLPDDIRDMLYLRV
jgi:hypothetical protein